MRDSYNTSKSNLVLLRAVSDLGSAGSKGQVKEKEQERKNIVDELYCLRCTHALSLIASLSVLNSA